MTLPEVLDVIERLLRASEHPDIVKVERYGTATESWGPTVERSKTKTVSGLKVTYQSTATALLAGRINSDIPPVPMPDQLPPPNLRAPRLVMFVAQLLDAARPAQFARWEVFGYPGAGEDSDVAGLPYGLGITGADGSKTLLMAQSTGAMVGREPDEEPFPDYVIPDGLAAVVR